MQAADLPFERLNLPPPIHIPVLDAKMNEELLRVLGSRKVMYSCSHCRMSDSKWCSA